MTVRRLCHVAAAGILLTLLAGCASPRGSAASAPAPPVVRAESAPASVDPAVASALTTAKDYLTGAVYDGDPDFGLADYTGALRVDDQLGGRHDRLAADVRVSGTPGELSVTVRRSSNDAGRTVDVLHRPGNPHRDYLLLGSDYKAVAPTAWVTVPAEFGRGVGCGMPARGFACEVIDDLMANQRLAEPLPTNAVAAGSATLTVTSAITVRQALHLGVWSFVSAGKPLLAKASAQELDHTLIGGHPGRGRLLGHGCRAGCPRCDSPDRSRWAAPRRRSRRPGPKVRTRPWPIRPTRSPSPAGPFTHR